MLSARPLSTNTLRFNLESCEKTRADVQLRIISPFLPLFQSVSCPVFNLPRAPAGGQKRADNGSCSNSPTSAPRGAVRQQDVAELVGKLGHTRVWLWCVIGGVDLE